MKQTTSKQKFARSTVPVAEQEPPTGAQGVALAPPVSGMALMDSQSVQRMVNRQPENRTGLPDRLKAGMEALSGMSLDDVRVYYNSAKPAQLRALAYAQGPEIHVGPEQERHLPHEAWHVVQQKQGRVQPTVQTRQVIMNDDQSLEREADVMGQKASVLNQIAVAPAATRYVERPVVQRMILMDGKIKKDPENTYKRFPTTQLRGLGLTDAQLKFAKSSDKNYLVSPKYYTLLQLVKEAQREYDKANKGVRVNPPNPGKRLLDSDDVIDETKKLKIDTTTMEDKFTTKGYGDPFSDLLSQVPFTDSDLAAVPFGSDPYASLMHHVNKTHVPAMVRTPSFLVETLTSLVAQDASTSKGFSSANKGSMFESWVAQNLIASSGKVTITKQGTMNKQRQSDGYHKASQTLYDAKFYETRMPKSTNDNQWDDYQEIVNNGYTGTGGESVTTICYVFPTENAAKLNTHLEDTNIIIAYPTPGTTKLQYV